MQQYILAFEPQVSVEVRKDVIMRLKEMDCDYSVGTNNSFADAAKGKVPMIDYISILWTFREDFLSSEFYSNLPAGCKISSTQSSQIYTI